ncbi:MAG: TIGR00341 family protein [Firmicutes bacterium]|nr:TIGR00341 family protein [Bacillota bacterium]
MSDNKSRIIVEVDLIKNERLEKVYSKVEASSNPTKSFYILICLSTIIAAYGLLSNSTAVVIGAMLVAPLMGPIFGIALSLSVDDKKLLFYSLFAEVTGIVVVVLLGILIGSIPYRPELGSEILARTTPNIYDILIALASGLAGAYSFVDERLSPALPGVAIATALVPPLTTCGLCIAYGKADLATGAFILFFANFVSIELAAAIVFFIAGIRKRSEKEVHTVIEFFSKFSFRIVVLVLISMFLTTTLVGMLREKRFNKKVKGELTSNLVKNTGAQLSDLKISKIGSNYSVVATILTPREFSKDMVASLENNLKKRVNNNISLVVRSIISRDMERTGPAFIGSEEKQDIENKQKQKKFYDTISRNLTEQLSYIPGSSLLDFVSDETDGEISITANIRTPIELGPDYVSKMQDNIAKKTGKPTKLVIRSILSRDADAKRFLYESDKKEPEMTNEQLLFYNILEQNLKKSIQSMVDGATLTEFRYSGEKGEILVIADVRSPRVFNKKDVAKIEKKLKKTVSPGIFLIIRTTVGGNSSSEGYVIDLNGLNLFPGKSKEGQQ